MKQIGSNKVNMKNIMILLIMLSFTSGCYNAPDAVKPMPWIFKMMPKDAPNNFKRGWMDGCETGLASMTNSFYKAFYTFKQTPKLRDDPVYYSVWKDTYNFCRHYVYGTLRQSNQRMNLPGRRSEWHETFMGAEGILEVGMLNLWGPGDWLLPFQQIGSIGGNTDLPSLGGGEAWSQVIGGQSTLDFSDAGMADKFGVDMMSGGVMNFGKDVPFFQPSDDFRSEPTRNEPSR